MTPRCSIVIPVHGKAALTRRCLDALFSPPAGVPDDVEVIVVDDASTDATPKVLARYGDRLRVIRRDKNGGFARACNEGAAAAAAVEHLVFLNNDIVPRKGWLGDLLAYASEHPRAAVVGSKLLFPDGSVQHAGVVISQDGFPRHLYAGFPGDHAAVCRSRPLQAVTAACCLVRRDAFSEAGGFDDAFRNGYEDVDLCLRLGEFGYEVHYCAASTLEHLESVSRSQSSAETRENLQLWRQRWAGRVRPDELALYLEDGLLSLDYGELYPLRLHASPLLARVDGTGTEETTALLAARERDVSDLLREVVRLTVRVAELELGLDLECAGVADGGETAGSPQLEGDLLDRIHDLQAAVAGTVTPKFGLQPFEPSPRLTYRRLVEKVRDTVASAVPAEAVVAVISKGDEALLEFEGRAGWHFPQTQSGSYAGHHPADSADAIAHLEELRTRGAEYLVIPETAAWWLEHYADFARYLEQFYVRTFDTPGVCVAYALCEPRRALEAERRKMKGFEDLENVVAEMLPERAAVAVLATGTELPEASFGRLFPQDCQAEEDALISELEALAEGEADYLVVPNKERPWLRAHQDFRRHLEARFRRTVVQERLCTIYALEKGRP